MSALPNHNAACMSDKALVKMIFCYLSFSKGYIYSNLSVHGMRSALKWSETAFCRAESRQFWLRVSWFYPLSPWVKYENMFHSPPRKSQCTLRKWQWPGWSRNHAALASACSFHQNSQPWMRKIWVIFSWALSLVYPSLSLSVYTLREGDWDCYIACLHSD